MRLKRLLTTAAALAVSAGALATAPASASTGWQDGYHAEDTILSCITSLPTTGVSANVGWSSPTGRVPKVGEVFHLRGYVGLVGMPCSGKVAVLPEIMLPAGTRFASGPVVWDHTPAGQPQQLGTEPIEAYQGIHGGGLLTMPGEEPFILRQGDILEFRFPVVADRPLKGPATRAPDCVERTQGTAPCPVAQSGDHAQIAFTVGGHGGSKSYVTPYVPLFASAADSGGTPGQQPKVSSTTTATYKVGRRPGRATIKVRAAKRPTGKVVVRDRSRGGRVVGKGVLKPADRGVVKVRVARLPKGTRRLVVRYAGSRVVAPSSSKVTTVRVR